MSLFRNMFGLGAQAPAGAAPATASPAPAAAAVPVGDTESVRRIAARLGALPPARARFVAAFAYLLARAADADLAVNDAEAAEMAKLVAEAGGLDADTASIVVELARTRADGFGATDDYLVTREFKAISTPQDREQLLRCILLVAAADNDIDAEEAWLVNRVAEELDVPRTDLNRIRAEFHDQISGVKELRRMRESADPASADPEVAPAVAAASAATPAPSGPAGDLPDGVGIEPVYLVEVPYTAKAAELRPRYRKEHLTRLASLRADGRVIEAGGTVDMVKAVLLIRAASAEEALGLIAEDVYTTGGVWHSPTAVGYGRVVPQG